MTEIYLIVIAYLILTVWLVIEGGKRKIGYVRSFIFSFFLTPLVGFAFVYNSDKKILYKVTYYKCSRCEFEFTEYHEKCPICAKEGFEIELKEVTKEMT